MANSHTTFMGSFCFAAKSGGEGSAGFSLFAKCRSMIGAGFPFDSLRVKRFVAVGAKPCVAI